MRRRFDGAAVGIALVAFVVAVPSLYLGLRLAGARGALRLIGASETGALVGRTATLGLAVGAGALLIGGGLGWSLARWGASRGVAVALAASPLAVPPFVAAFALDGIIRGFAGATIALVATTAPMVLLAVWLRLSSLTPAAEDAAATLGRHRLAAGLVAFRAVAPWAGSAAALAAVTAIADLGATGLMGYDALVPHLVLADAGGTARIVHATAAIVLGALPLVLAWLSRAVRRQVGPLVDPAPSDLPASVGRWPDLASVVPSLVGLGVTAAVLTRLAWWAIVSTRRGNALLPRALATSAVSAGAVAVVSLVTAVVFLTARRRDRTGWVGVMSGIPGAGAAVPSAVVAVALGLIATRHLTAAEGTIGLLAAALVIRFVAVAVPTALAGTPASARVDAAAVLRASSGTRLGRFVWGPATAAAAVAALAAVRELPAAVLLRPDGTSSLTSVAFAMPAIGLRGVAARAALLVVATGLVVLASVGRRAVHLGRAAA